MGNAEFLPKEYEYVVIVIGFPSRQSSQERGPRTVLWFKGFGLLKTPSLAKLKSSEVVEVVVEVLEFFHCCPKRESLVTHLFTLEEYESMSCRKCRSKPSYPEKSSYGIVMAADSIRDLKCAFENIKFEDILKVILMEDGMACDIKTRGCGKNNVVHHIIGCSEEGEYICMAYKKNRWVSHKHEVLSEEGVGNWNSVVRLFGERKIQTEVLFYEAVQWTN